MKIDSVHTEFLSGNAVSTTVSTHSVVSRDSLETQLTSVLARLDALENA